MGNFFDFCTLNFLFTSFLGRADEDEMVSLLSTMMHVEIDWH